MTPDNILLYFSQNQILSQVEKENVRKYLTKDCITLCEFRSGDIIYSPQSSKKLVGLVVSGKIAALSDNALLRMIPENDIFGIANLYSDDSYPSTIVAKSTAYVLMIDEKAFKLLLENDSKLLRVYLAFMSNKIMFLNKKISSLTAGSAEKKLAVFLVDNQQEGVYTLPSSITSLADMINVGRASVYRAIETLSEEGLILRQGKNIIINDKNALLKYI